VLLHITSPCGSISKAEFSAMVTCQQNQISWTYVTNITSLAEHELIISDKSTRISLNRAFLSKTWHYALQMFGVNNRLSNSLHLWLFEGGTGKDCGVLCIMYSAPQSF
jgi:hypothetical protein